MTPILSAEAVRGLVRQDQVHKDLYLNPALFELERQEFFGNTWQYAGHASQIPQPLDYFTVDIAGQSLLVLRDNEGEVRALHNRCAHKGVRMYTAESGKLGARMLRCPYHAWSYKLDGTLAAYPLRAGYEGTHLCDSANGKGMAPVSGLRVYRGFIFVRVNPQGLDFEDYFGEALAGLDQMVDRSPVGELVIEGGVLRNTIHCNWKFYLENINDTVHPVSTHESAVRAAQAQWKGQDPAQPKPLAIEQILPFGQSYQFFEGMGGRVLPNGHSVSGTRASVHSGYGELGDYVQALAAAHGEEKARQILEHSPQNAVLYPSLAVKGSPQTIRVIRPVAVDRTVVEAWNFRTVGAPDLLFERALNYSRLVFSPMSIVAHDDIHLFEQQQQGLKSGPNDWVSLHRDFTPAELGTLPLDTNGSSELLIRNQYRAWADHMTRRLA